MICVTVRLGLLMTAFLYIIFALKIKNMVIMERECLKSSNRKGTTLLEITNQYEDLALKDSAYYFSVKSIVEKLNQLKRTN